MEIQQDMKTACPLCESTGLSSLSHLQMPLKSYWHCQICDLISLAPKDHVSLDAEKQRYQQHTTSGDDQGHLQFLQQLTLPLQKHWSSQKHRLNPRVLDFGSGPNSRMPQLFPESWGVDFYDPFFFPREISPSPGWDIVASTEVWEHFRDPKIDIEKQIGLVKPDGILAVMTQFHQGPEAFSQWWYARDFTHVIFFSEKTFHWVAEKWNLLILEIDSPIAIFQKKS